MFSTIYDELNSECCTDMRLYQLKMISGHYTIIMAKEHVSTDI